MPFELKPLWPAHTGPDPAMCGESDRLSVMASYGLDALTGDDELQRIVEFSAKLCAAPIAFVSLVEEERQRFLARAGLDETETPRATSFCAHAMLESETMVVPDATEDPRFSGNPLVTGHPNIRFYAGAPLVSAEGAPLGSLCIIDTEPRPQGLTELQLEGLEVLARGVMQRLLTERQDRAAMQAIKQREQELRHMLDSVPGIAWSARSNGVFDMFNARWEELTGAKPPLNAEEWRPFLHPEDWDDALAVWEKAFAESTLYGDEYRLKHADGTYRWVLARAVPVLQEGGAETRWFGTAVDVDEAHRQSDARELLASELSHRIKNIFAVVSSLISMRARNHDDVQAFATDITETIRSLGIAHDFVRPVDGRSADSLKAMLRELVAPYQNGDSTRIRVKGESLPIGSKAATPLALVFHELATNSAKYGALSHNEGTVEIAINPECNDDGNLCFSWSEDSPNFVSPDDGAAKGFGSRLIDLAIRSQLRGDFDRTYTEKGLHVEIAVPIETVSA
ncbi:PAS domain S-box protein [Erythrobacter litoralis]|uniref:sensor histidine kinase n=1 Tax=Erythrobacter litoralis TaxID=39960 RepID=UPI002434E570|nr:PAS domain-containing protein [Erythrobacter litoralis]MDG6079200.1 PAS domain S-box protein [Erythrobacter litoralis]